MRSRRADPFLKNVGGTFAIQRLHDFHLIVIDEFYTSASRSSSSSRAINRRWVPTCAAAMRHRPVVGNRWTREVVLLAERFRQG